MTYDTTNLDTNDAAALRAFIVNLMDGCYNEGDTIEPSATEIALRDRIRNA